MLKAGLLGSNEAGPVQTEVFKERLGYGRGFPLFIYLFTHDITFYTFSPVEGFFCNYPEIDYFLTPLKYWGHGFNWKKITELLLNVRML